MSYDYDPPRRTSRYYREDRYDDRDDPYVRGVHSRDLVARPSRDDSDLAIEEIRRDFPPPGHSHAHTHTHVSREIRRARSTDRGGYDDYDDRRSYYSRDSRDRDPSRDRAKKSSTLVEEEKEKRHRTLTQQEKIIAAIAGAALAVGGKELYDRREAKQEGSADVHRNPLASAALGAAGALAAYQGVGLYNKRAEKDEKKSTLIVHKGRDGQLTKYYSEEEEDPKQKKGHKNFLESALAAAGLGSAVKALTGGGGDDKDKDKKSDTRSRRGSRSSSRSRSKEPEKKNKIQQAAMASLIAGATEAFRVAKEPGGWKGEKAKRVFTAAAGAATIDAAQNPEKNQKLSLAESVIGGLVGNRVLHGSKKNIEEDKATGRSRSRSRAPSKSGESGGGGGVSGLAALATAGLGAIGAKKIMDNHKDKKDEEARSRSRRRSSVDSRDESPDRRRSRSRSVVSRGLARLGIGNGDDDRDRRSRSRSRAGGRRYSDELDDDDRYSRRGGGRDRRDSYDDDRDRRRSRSRSRVGGRRRGGDSESDLGDTDDEERQTRKKRDGRNRY